MTPREGVMRVVGGPLSEGKGIRFEVDGRALRGEVFFRIPDQPLEESIALGELARRVLDVMEIDVLVDVRFIDSVEELRQRGGP